MVKNINAILGACLLFLTPSCIAEVEAKAPLNISTPLQYARVGSPVWGRRHTVPTGTNFANVVGHTGTTTTASDAHLFEWGTMVVVSCQTTAANFCFVMDTDEMSMDNYGTVTDTDTGAGNGNDGVGSCFRVEAGTYRDVTIFRENFRDTNKVGRRTGYCSGNTSTVEWPCDANADCGSGGTCNTTATNNNNLTFEKIRGAFLYSRAAASTTCFIVEEK